MREIHGNLWSWYGKPSIIVLITTNGIVTAGGRAVMGRGCAEEAKLRFKDIDLELGRNIRIHGNQMYSLGGGLIWSFPVKRDWRDKADLGLIGESASQLEAMALRRVDEHFILPRPGCGNGGRTWDEVGPVIDFLPDNVLVISK
jgi:hypothetical protein